jgi:hypothetical protein
MEDSTFSVLWFPQPSSDVAISGEKKNFYWIHALLILLHLHVPPMPWLFVSEFKPKEKKPRENHKLVKDYLVFITSLLQPQMAAAMIGIS